MSDWRLGIDFGIQLMLAEALEILRDEEWHELSKNYSSTSEDLHHDSTYCWACQVAEQLITRSRNIIKGEANA